MGPHADGQTGGTYTLLVALASPARTEIGRLGTVELPAGHYAYTGEVHGPGGFAGVDRHRAVAADERAVRQWHVDHLLGLHGASVTAAVRSPGVDAECAIARGIDGDRIDGFGATDCDCGSHLAHATDRDALYESTWAAHERASDAAESDGGDVTVGGDPPAED